jgi:hypothetical protein
MIFEKKNGTEHKMCWFSLELSPGTCLILQMIRRKIIEDAYSRLVTTSTNIATVTIHPAQIYFTSPNPVFNIPVNDFPTILPPSAPHDQKPT